MLNKSAISNLNISQLNDANITDREVIDKEDIKKQINKKELTLAANNFLLPPIGSFLENKSDIDTFSRASSRD